MKFFLMTLFALLSAFGVALLALIAMGEAPLSLWEALVTSFSAEGLGYTLFYTTPLIFTGLAVAVSFHGGLFNIGGEGQLYMGSLAIVAVASYFPSIPSWLAIMVGVFSALIAGGLWGAVAGVLKGMRGSHEVIVTILLNFIAYSIVDYGILYVFKDPASQSPETSPIGGGYQLPTLAQLGVGYFESTPANVALFIALVFCLLVWLFLFRTRSGYELRAVGKSPRAARFAGIGVTRSIILALGISGALAAMVGINEIMGYEHRLIQGFSPQYGFTGIAVALLARNHPLGIVAAALLFGTLHNMSREIEFLTTHVSKEIALVMQAMIIGIIAVINPKAKER